MQLRSDLTNLPILEPVRVRPTKNDVSRKVIIDSFFQWCRRHEGWDFVYATLFIPQPT